MIKNGIDKRAIEYINNCEDVNELFDLLKDNRKYIVNEVQMRLQMRLQILQLKKLIYGDGE